MTKPDGEPEAAKVDVGGSDRRATGDGWRSRMAGLWRLYRLAAPDTRGKLVASCAIALVAVLLPLTLVFVAALLADRAAGTAGGGIVGWASQHNGDELAVFLGLVALVTAAAFYFEITWFAELGSFAAVELRKRVFGSLISLPLGFFAGSRMDEVADMVEGDLEKVHSAWCVGWRLLWRICLLVAVTTVALFMIEGQLATIVLGALVIIVALCGWLLKVAPPELGLARRVFREAVQALPVLKSFANENHERGRLRHALAKTSAAEQRRTRWRSGVLAIGGLLVMAVAIFYLRYRAQQIAEVGGSFETGRTLAFVLLTAVLLVSAARLVLVFMRMSTAGEAAQHLSAILAERSEQLENGPYLPDSRGRLEGRVDFDKVSGSSSDKDGESRSLADITVKIELGQKIAVVGADGAGRSLLLEMLLGFYEVEGGEISIDDRPLSDYPLAWLRSQIGWLPREPQFFSASVAENIGYGRPGASEKEILEAAEKAAAFEFIEQLPNGIDSMMSVGVDDGTGAFSPNRGQRHRLALARIFLEDPPLLAIEGLDPRAVNSPAGRSRQQLTGTEVFAQIAEAEDLLIQDRTTLVVARRLSVTRDADRILVMRGGLIEEQGSHAELYEAKGYYRLLCEGSFGRY